ncbi:MAG: DUF1822 family protein [Symploca sp. SIO2C1]|nr:DUF1822 family protein [Symploca sp. SIO2C1]
MNSQERPFLAVPLGIEAHGFAKKFAAEQSNTAKSKQVYLNTLAVYAAHRFLTWLGIETDLNKSDSWQPIIRNRCNIADLMITDRGRLECRPVLPGEERILLPPEVIEERLGYLAVQFSDRLDQVELLGFTITAVSGVIEISSLHAVDELIQELSLPQTVVFQPLQPVVFAQWFQGIFDEGWQTLDSLLAPRQLAYRSSRAISNKTTNPGEETIERAKPLNLGLLADRKQLVLVVSISPEENQEVRVVIQIHPMETKEFLPPGLKLKVTLDSDSVEVVARDTDNWLQVPLTEVPGKTITVEISRDDAAVTETFVV